MGSPGQIAVKRVLLLLFVVVFSTFVKMGQHLARKLTAFGILSASALYHALTSSSLQFLVTEA